MGRVGSRGAVINESEADDEQRRPDDEEQENRKRAVEAEEGFAAFDAADPASHVAPRGPSEAVVQTSEAPPAGDAPRQDDRFEGFPQNDHDDNDSGDGRKNHAACSKCASMVISAFRTRETGQLAFALDAALWKASAEMPGMLAATSRWILEMVQPASSFSRVSVAVVRRLCGVKFMVPSCAERAMVKHPA